jgi:hypothetical protein
MQADPKEIYKKTAARTEKPLSLYKEIGTAVFAELYQQLRRPQSLIIKLKGVGSWYLRKARMNILLNIFPHDYDKNPQSFESPLELLKYENSKEIYEIFTQRMKEYEEYIELKKQIRAKRNESQTLIQPSDGEK